MSKLRKLRQTSLDELRVRGSQAIASFAERQGWYGAAKLLSDEQLLRLLDRDQFERELESPLELRDYSNRKRAPAFFPGLVRPKATIKEFRQRWPNSDKEIIGRADRAIDGYFDLLGFHNLYFGQPIDWQLEPIAGKRAPLIHWSKVNYLDSHLFGDKKITWELNRHQYFVTLGQAYWLTADERYAKAFASHLDHWIEHNPPKLGINWASSLEVAFRSISWLWALQFFKDSSSLTAETWLGASKILHLNARHLETYLSTYFSPNTHLTGEALGLFYLGTLLPEFLDSVRWRNTGLQILLEQLNRHVQEDGVYFEQSSYYHRYTTDFYLHLRILLSANREDAPSELDKKLQLLLDHLMYITRPDGTTPLFGDDDGGRLLTLQARQANDFRSTLATGAALFQRSDYKFVSEGVGEETLWLLGPQGLSNLDQVETLEPSKQSVGFPTGGYYVMRDGWTPRSNYLLFDCGPHGTNNCGHAHADALSFELAVNGCTFLVDPGTYTYTGSSHMRDWFRSSAAHNTLTIDGESSSVPAGPFSWKSIANSQCQSWITRNSFDYVSASHNGFNRLPTPVVHQRTVLFLKKKYWVVRDRLGFSGKRTIQTWFHFDAGVGPLQHSENSVRAISANDCSAGLRLLAFSGHGEWIREEGWVSHCYGEKEEAPVFTFSIVARGSTELVTFLMPEVPGASSKVHVRQIESVNSCAFEIDFGSSHDVLVLRDPIEFVNSAETGRIKSDFELTWARFESDDMSFPNELVLINGKSLEVNGTTLVSYQEKIEYLAALKLNNDYQLETQEGLSKMALPIVDQG